ncbi:MAG: cytidine deaminase [Clostridia bacterium]|nr:cytidine deaminase [Clostridia bacterium]
MKLNKNDLELIDMATSVLMQNLDLQKDGCTPVACVIKAKSGKVYKGINIKSSHSVCAEQVALGQALACGEREFDTVVAVKLDENNKPRVVSPCGLCRYIYNNLNLDINVIVEDVYKDVDLKVKSKELLPYPYKRIDDV